MYLPNSSLIWKAFGCSGHKTQLFSKYGECIDSPISFLYSNIEKMSLAQMESQSLSLVSLSLFCLIQEAETLPVKFKSMSTVPGLSLGPGGRDIISPKSIVSALTVAHRCDMDVSQQKGYFDWLAWVTWQSLELREVHIDGHWNVRGLETIRNMEKWIIDGWKIKSGDILQYCHYKRILLSFYQNISLFK